MYRPRTSQTKPTQMLGNKWWYSTGNVYYPQDGLPNCTCYAAGRIAEIHNKFVYTPLMDAKNWYVNYTSTGIPYGYEPKLGGIMCYAPETIDPDDPDDPSIVEGGHVSIVEEIVRNANNEIIYVTTSNSAYNGSYFFTENCFAMDNYLKSWMTPPNRHYYYQGCIYVTEDDIPDYIGKAHKSPIWMMLRYKH